MIGTSEGENPQLLGLITRTTNGITLQTNSSQDPEYMQRMGKAVHWPMSDVMGATNLGTIAQTAHIAVIMWQLPKVMLKVMLKQAKARANKIITEEEGEDVEGSPERMDEDVVEELMRLMRNQLWQMRRMKEQHCMRPLTTVELRTSMP